MAAVQQQLGRGIGDDGPQPLALHLGHQRQQVLYLSRTVLQLVEGVFVSSQHLQELIERILARRDEGQPVPTDLGIVDAVGVIGGYVARVLDDPFPHAIILGPFEQVLFYPAWETLLVQRLRKAFYLP